MSWQDYVDKQLLASKCVTKAAIVGHDGHVWAKSDGFDVSKVMKNVPRAGLGPARWRTHRHRRNQCIYNLVYNQVRFSEAFL